MCILLLLILINYVYFAQKSLPIEHSPRDGLLAPACGIPVGTHTRMYVFQRAPYGPGARWTHGAHTIGDLHST
jgi:hypothetical protein